MPALPLRLGVVIIGRNEGERLRRCLASLAGQASWLVYVDSGSSDDSVALAAGLGAHVVDLDRNLPFTAARARNIGFARLCDLDPNLDFVQFVDGDCEVVASWIARAAAQLASDATLAVVCGRRRERYPEASPYNRLCDIEWNTPIGLADACGGDALMRVRPLSEVGGYNSDLIAGEEPDLCLRLRQRGWRILRMDAEMTVHDANITRISQWWKRSVRSGHAYAEGFTRHRREPGGYYASQVRSNLAWGAALPVLVAGLALPSGGLSGLLLAGYAVLGLRVFKACRRRGFSASDSRLYAWFCVLGKFPAAYGQLRYWTRLALGRRSALIEYKSVG
jgi:glycosyltransferase involved in cell wall biosynthesis